MSEGFMKRTLVAALLGFAVLSFSGLADAQKKPKPGKVEKKGDKKFDFEADEVTGELIKPEGSDISARKFAEHTSLIRVRQDFIREIVKSAEDL